ncbi:uncharacterized protein BO88DRAFT_444355 [Aspergillus vadensis CBS 113365]|uniref:TLDc domain-containing protein n=1 Tax=Aspergillus vadensis (strain CBS 113365 / IMI 142717 / IBT 24658) TaxID=1448311 RepID=A0A319B9Z8_ASPVC|nr:hypothetical protein BO88DRAFT_444355 [Aspergillus vadensis CBS 113365]PYH68674.1 hypothetical protein BO88DRAFT_444355 [Aspergillus vadensis CBS 113365]
MAVLDRVAFNILFRDQKKRLDQFLRTTTPDSVLSHLHTCLLQKESTTLTPRAIFYTHSIQDSSQEQPYWTKKSFQSCLARNHPDTTIPETAIDVLWSCFCFYAYHPFPLIGADDRKLELPAFERALILLSLQGTELLGIEDDGFGRRWGPFREKCNCKVRINRIFRSISIGSPHLTSHPHVTNFDTLVTEDAIDAMLTICPSHPKLSATPEKLTPLAERLLEGRTVQFQMKVKDLAHIICLIMRLRVYKTTWGRGFHYGSLEEPSPEKEELANVLAQSFSHDQDESLSPDLVLRALEILPNLEQWFHQLWATLFQPSPSTELPTLETALSPDSTWNGILRAVSLFVPPSELHQRTDLHRKTKPIVFSKCHDSTDRFDLGHVLQHIRHDDPKHRSHLVLLLGHQGQDSTRVVVGAFFSGDTQSPAANEERESIALPRLLFQLQPSLDLFHLGGKRIRALLPVNESDTEKTDSHNCMGELTQSRVGVKIDPATSHATFFRGNNPARNRVSGLYEEATSTRKHDGCDAMNGDQQERETSFTVTRLAIFHVEGGPNYDYD